MCVLAANADLQPDASWPRAALASSSAIMWFAGPMSRLSVATIATRRWRYPSINRARLHSACVSVAMSGSANTRSSTPGHRRHMVVVANSLVNRRFPQYILQGNPVVRGGAVSGRDSSDENRYFVVRQSPGADGDLGYFLLPAACRRQKRRCSAEAGVDSSLVRLIAAVERGGNPLGRSSRTRRQCPWQQPVPHRRSSTCFVSDFVRSMRDVASALASE